jgi:hypothetical protein
LPRSPQQNAHQFGSKLDASNLHAAVLTVHLGGEDWIESWIVVYAKTDTSDEHL